MRNDVEADRRVRPRGFCDRRDCRLVAQAAHLLSHGVAAAIGVAIPAAVVLAYLVRTDILGDMPALYRQISRYANETPWELMDACKIGVVAVIGGFPLIVRGWIYRRSEHRAADTHLDRGPVVFVIAWVLIELLGRCSSVVCTPTISSLSPPRPRWRLECFRDANA